MAALGKVVPLKPEYARPAVTRVDAPDATQPAQLYDRIVFTLLVHGHAETDLGEDGVPDYGDCVQCGQPWPCPPALLAWRLQEGFWHPCIRLPSPRSQYVMAVRHRMAYYCQDRRLRVGRIFVDEECSLTTASRPGFASMCQRIHEEQPYGVPILHPRDLAKDEESASSLASLARASGVQLLSLNEGASRFVS